MFSIFTAYTHRAHYFLVFPQLKSYIRLSHLQTQLSSFLVAKDYWFTFLYKNSLNYINIIP